MSAGPPAYTDDAPLTPQVVRDRIPAFSYPFDGRYEDLWKGEKGSTAALIFRDACAGLIVAMVLPPS